MRIRDFIGGRWIAEDRGLREPVEEYVSEPIIEIIEPMTAPLEQFLPKNDVLALRQWGKSLPCRS